MKAQLDAVEREYLAAIDRADTDESYELSIGLAQYRELYRCPPPDLDSP